MPSLSPVGWTAFCLLLLWETRTARSEALQCSVPGRAGSPHPVQGLLERFEAGPGCAAREPGNQETHVVALGRVTGSRESKVTVHLKPLSPPWPALRSVRLLLSSRLPVAWWLRAEALPPGLLLQVEVSSNSSVRAHGVGLSVHTVRSLPFRPRALHRWTVKHHGSLSSMTHTAQGNQVYIRLGEDPTQPAVCQLQSMFLSHNYIVSDLQPQEVQGCSRPRQADRTGPEVHVIKLHSSGSGLCGSLQVEVVVSLLPPLGKSKAARVVLILSSSVPVNWAVVAGGVRGHVTVHSSNSVSPPFPPEPGLTLSSTVTSDLSTAPDLLDWARESGYPEVTSYTEADLANRFVVQLCADGTDEEEEWRPAAPGPAWAEERRLTQRISGGGGGRQQAGRESFAVNCEDGRLSVAVEQRVLQDLPVPVSAVTLSDPACQAHSNRSHFLLVFPVISCGTESLLLRQPRGVQYENTVLLWKDKSPNRTEKSGRPLRIHFSCFVSVPGPAEPGGSQIWTPEGPRFNPGLTDLPKPRAPSGPVLLLKLSTSESSEETRVGPCVITADQRVHVQISARAPVAHSVRVKSCVVSPLSDPKKSPYWTVIRDGCSSDPSLTLSEEEEEEEEEEPRQTSPSARGGAGAEQIPPLRFSFILRPVYQEPMQFLHCSLRLCVSDGVDGNVGKDDCRDGLPIPPLVSGSPGAQCEARNLSRPMVVTQSISSLAPKIHTPAGQRTKRLSVNPADSPPPERSGTRLLRTDRTRVRHDMWSPSALSDQSSSSV
ncbi:transforming growth factor beta receptor type 3 isoform X2 [Salarias fasciatus]|uniref:transforming growth factor beta receptor type 3 isoform X2 n=1 Tax=Salarias fasciatus TaxID=181472 RepID=UPI001176BAA0|nr:transforming growth factor beta receptor type 3-like isoform X2 [Salarias fasciatus]